MTPVHQVGLEGSPVISPFSPVLQTVGKGPGRFNTRHNAWWTQISTESLLCGGLFYENSPCSHRNDHPMEAGEWVSRDSLGWSVL